MGSNEKNIIHKAEFVSGLFGILSSFLGVVYLEIPLKIRYLEASCRYGY